MPKGSPGSRPVCSIDGCDRTSIARGWCPTHYDHWRNHGHPTVATPRERVAAEKAAAEELFWSRVQIPDDRLRCWEWMAAKNANGYGVCAFPYIGTNIAHRIAYELCLGPIPQGLDIDHLCRNRACVNPVHLDPVTNAENTRRGVQSRKTHCKYGHAYTPENTAYTKTGVRRCRTCERANSRAQRERRRIVKATDRRAS